MKKLLLLPIILLPLMIAGQVWVQEKPKNVIKVSHLGTHDVAITCLNGADPTGVKQGDILIISCGREGDDRPDYPRRKQ